MNPYNVASLFFAAWTFLVGLLIWFRRQDAIGKMYFAFSCAVTIWAVGFSVLASDNVSYDVAFTGIRYGHIGAVLIPVLWLHFVLIFVNKTEQYKWALLFFYVVTLSLETIVFSPKFMPRLAPALTFTHYSRAGELYHLFTVMFFFTVFFAFTAGRSDGIF